MRNGSTRGGNYSIRCGVEVGIHNGVGGPVSENDGVAGESDGESGGDGGVGKLERAIPLCPYVPNSSFGEPGVKEIEGSAER
jgi:hypothetical protein